MMEFLKLRPLPLSPAGRLRAERALRARLRETTLDALVKERTDAIYSSSQAGEDSAEQAALARLRKNMAIAYTRDELEWAVRADFQRLLSPSGAGGDDHE